MLEHERLGDRDVYKAAMGVLEIWKPSPSVVAVRLVGKLDLEFAAQLLHSYDETLAAGHQLDVFADWREMTGYASQTRSTVTIWCEANRPRIRSVNVLLGSEIGRLRIGIINEMLAGLITSYTDPDQFDLELQRAAAIAA